MSAIDRAKLVAWLNDRANRTSSVVGAVYAGLVSRIEHGEFDEERDKEKHE